MSILTSNNLSIDQQPIDREWVKTCGIYQIIKRDPVMAWQRRDGRDHMDHNAWFGTIKDIFGISVYPKEGDSVYLKSQQTRYFGNTFCSETMETRGDVKHFLNVVCSIHGYGSK